VSALFWGKRPITRITGLSDARDLAEAEDLDAGADSTKKMLTCQGVSDMHGYNARLVATSAAVLAIS